MSPTLAIVRPNEKIPKVVIVGGGFAGLSAAKQLRTAKAEVTVIDKRNHHLFQPLLYQVATSALSPADIAYPIRSIFRNQENTRVIMADVSGVELSTQKVLTNVGEIPYDYLVLATGALYNYFGHEEWEKFAPNLKSIADATAIREKILRAFEAAELETDIAKHSVLMTFVLVGAGPTGVEMAGAIAELAHAALASDFRNINPRATRIVLLDASPRILMAFSEDLSEQAARKLKSLGVEVRANARVEKVEENRVIVNGETIDCSVVIWTAGVKASPVAKWLGVEGDSQGRVKVTPNLSIDNYPNVFVAGDAAHVIDDEKKPLPGLAPVAIQQGVYLGKKISRAIVEKQLPQNPFKCRDKGILATVGRGSAVAEIGRTKVHGFTAWLLWLVIHLFYLIGFRNRLMVLIQWAWSYITFQRGARLITREVDTNR